MIVWANPSISSNNIGDRIIAHYVGNILTELFPGEQIVESPTQLVTFSRRLDRLLANARLIVVGGSNLMSHRYPRIHQWANIHQYLRHHEKIVLCGVGWHSYESHVWPWNKKIISLFDNGRVHSVRDNYSKEKLANFGVECLMTSCPTTWALSLKEMQSGPVQKLLFTLTYYRKDERRDSKFVTTVIEEARRLGSKPIFWPQSPEDMIYLSKLGVDITSIEMLQPSLAALECNIDVNTLYIGTRLHGGIHALNLGASARVFAIDNRAREIGKDIGLPTFSSLADISFASNMSDRIDLPKNEIDGFQAMLKKS